MMKGMAPENSAMMIKTMMREPSQANRKWARLFSFVVYYSWHAFCFDKVVGMFFFHFFLFPI
jgi:hypothetical protein